MPTQDIETPVTVISAPSGWEFIDFKELARYRDLFFFLVWRDIKVLYAQTILGFSWAILNPLVQIVIFSIIFGGVAKIETDGIPYLLFSTVAIIPWTYMSEAMTNSSQSLVTNQNMLGKVYFPRVIFPLTAILARLVDFAISLLLLAGIMIYYGVKPTASLLYLPLFFALMICVPASVGLWMSALAIRFRDVKFAMPFIIRMLIYTAPILYTANAIPEKYRLIYSFNPLVAVIEGYRASLLGRPLEWQYVVPGMVVALVLLVTAALYFRRLERTFVDVI